MTASVLKQSLALYFPIICSWQLSSSEKSLVRKKNSSIYLKDFTDFYYRNIFFFIYFDKCPCYPCRLRPAVLGTANRFVGSETPKYNAFDLFSKNFKDLNSISNIFQETHDFLVLTNSVILLYLFLERTSVSFFEKNH